MFRLAGRELPFVGQVRAYVCGITPYDTTHLGHAATFVWADAAARVLRHAGLEVQVCRNITDVDDDLLAQARRTGEDWRHLAARETYRFADDMRALHVARPTAEPASHNHVDEVVQLAAALLAAGAAYERDGSVLFAGESVVAAAGLERGEALALLAAHAPPDGFSHATGDSPFDVAVWQRSEPGEPSWDSPWGPGRPGWHAECAAMALATLGCGIDLHGGGADLAFPHHAFEAAMAEAATGVRPFARAWLRPGTVSVGGEKMAKSTGNLVFLHDLLAGWPAEAIRLLILDRPWAQPWEYRPAGLEAAAARADRLAVLAGRPGGSEAAEAEVLARLDDDLDVPGALAVAEESGGSAARLVGHVLALVDPRVEGRGRG